ncbi:MAG TPA: DUF559 domain-containing protein [Propionicimonas sp.]|nr:DUF559 domain-containing protein [Propionicimonas sp.]HQA77647.1 DUF559 domain-containing protein [Propionicimonas sp.]HQD97544.1 DUF559 domain-containing protein [Propionicimonas sp.]
MRIDDLLANGDGLVRLRDHPAQARTVQRAAKAGKVRSLLPGIYVTADQTLSAGLRLRAACAWSTSGVIHGHTAVEVYLNRPISLPIRLRAPYVGVTPVKWLKVSWGTVPSRREYSGVRVASPSHCAVELAATDDGEVIFDMLRRGLVTPDSLAEVLPQFVGTPGNRRRTRAVTLAADNPWSFAEARLHRLLRDAGIGGWVANRPILVRGRWIAPDVRFEREHLVLEFDGEAVHSTHDQFEDDRSRQNVLVLGGFRVLRITWRMLVEEPDAVLVMVRIALAQESVAISQGKGRSQAN